MQWKKLGLVFEIPKDREWLTTHAMVPTPLIIDDKIRVYFSSRNSKGKSHVGYVDLNRANPKEVIGISKDAILAPGELGAFDDSGVTVDSVVRVGNKIYMYYIGWNQGVNTPYRNSIGLAISTDNGNSFQRYAVGPIIERTPEEPFFCTSPWVEHENGDWKMWYACITSWMVVNGKPEPLYHIKYAHSKDGIHWNREGVDCILPLNKEEANVRPTVLFDGTTYRMWYCFRGSMDFRDGKDSYRLGYAESTDGKRWNRLDEKIESTGLMTSEAQDWDAKMQAYPALVQDGNRIILFYNGNGFGVHGFGAAIAELK